MFCKAKGKNEQVKNVQHTYSFIIYTSQTLHLIGTVRSPAQGYVKSTVPAPKMGDEQQPSKVLIFFPHA